MAMLLLLSDAMAAPAFDAEAVKGLAGRNVLLLVGPSETTAQQKAHYYNLLTRCGADPAKFPVYQARNLPNDVAGKLGLSRRGANYAALVRWGNPARFGPAQVLSPGVVTALDSEGQKELLARLPEDVAAMRPRPELVIENVDFQANGKPVYLVDTKVRLKNEGKLPANDVTVLFLVKNPDGSWFELGRHTDLVVKAGYTITRDLVRPTFDTPLLNERKEILPASYRIRVEYAGQSLEQDGEFTPLLLQDQP
jgi:hypothetical protein